MLAQAELERDVNNPNPHLDFLEDSGRDPHALRAHPHRLVPPARNHTTAMNDGHANSQSPLGTYLCSVRSKMRFFSLRSSRRTCACAYHETGDTRKQTAAMNHTRTACSSAAVFSWIWPLSSASSASASPPAAPVACCFCSNSVRCSRVPLGRTTPGTVLHARRTLIKRNKLVNRAFSVPVKVEKKLVDTLDTPLVPLQPAEFDHMAHSRRKDDSRLTTSTLLRSSSSSECAKHRSMSARFTTYSSCESDRGKSAPRLQSGKFGGSSSRSHRVCGDG